MRSIILAFAVLLAAFWLTSDACGQCANGVCRKPVATAAKVAVKAPAIAVRAAAKVAKPVVVAAVKAPAVVVRATAKAATAPVRYVHRHQPVRRFIRCRCR